MKKQKIRFYAALLCSSMVFSLVSTPVSAAETGQLTNPPTSTEELSSPESISGNEAAAILKVQQANADGIRFLKEAGADAAVLQLKSLEAFMAAADGKATKIIIPSDIQNMAGLVKSITEVAKDS